MARRASSTGLSVRWTIGFGLTFWTSHRSGTLGGLGGLVAAFA
jgi:hypothetical protein